MLKINGEMYEVIYHWVYNGPTSAGLYLPIMLKKVEE